MAIACQTERLIPIILLLALCMVSILLILTRNYRNTGALYRIVVSNRASISLIFQIISSVLGVTQIYVATSLFNFATRIWLCRSSTTLGHLHLWTAISARKAQLSLPWKSFIISAVLLAISEGPGALWAGALTPLYTTVKRDGAFIQTPIFTNSTRDVWDDQFQLRGLHLWNIEANCTSIFNEIGFVSSCPVPDLQGSLLNSGSTATTLSGAPRNHSKIDNPSWSFRGRSYGVGSSQGIVSPENLLDGSPLAYSYVEMGYDATVSCIKNTTSDFGIIYIASPSNVAVWELSGYLPNSVPGYPEYYPSMTWARGSNTSIVGWATVVNADAEDRNMIAIAAGTAYANLNQTQCSVTFNPQAFAVSVNVTEQSIIVNPCPNCSDILDIEPLGRLTSDTMWSVNLLSRMTVSLYESVLGNTLQRNIETLLARPGLNMTTEEATLAAISDSFTVIIDDILVAFGAAQLALSNASTATRVAASLPAVHFGQDSYICATACINAVLLLLVISEAIRTRFWRQLPLFDYTNIKATIVAASAGGGDIAQEVGFRHDVVGTSWAGDSKDEIVDGIEIQLLQNNVTGGVDVVLQTAKARNESHHVSGALLPLVVHGSETSPLTQWSGPEI